jgi:hypothetical protein
MSEKPTTPPPAAVPAARGRKKTNLIDLLPHLDANVLLEQLNTALSNVPEALLASDQAKPKAEVTLKLKFHRVKGAVSMVSLVHELSFVQPTNTAHKGETVRGETALHVGPGGQLMPYPEKQDPLFQAPPRQ